MLHYIDTWLDIQPGESSSLCGMWVISRF